MNLKAVAVGSIYYKAVQGNGELEYDDGFVDHGDFEVDDDVAKRYMTLTIEEHSLFIEYFTICYRGGEKKKRNDDMKLT